MSLEGVLTRAQRVRRDNADQEETQTWSVISDLHSPAAATRPTIIASTENTLLADREHFRPPGVLLAQAAVREAPEHLKRRRMLCFG